MCVGQTQRSGWIFEWTKTTETMLLKWEKAPQISEFPAHECHGPEADLSPLHKGQPSHGPTTIPSWSISVVSLPISAHVSASTFSYPRLTALTPLWPAFPTAHRTPPPVASQPPQWQRFIHLFKNDIVRQEPLCPAQRRQQQADMAVPFWGERYVQ